MNSSRFTAKLVKQGCRCMSSLFQQYRKLKSWGFVGFISFLYGSRLCHNSIPTVHRTLNQGNNFFNRKLESSTNSKNGISDLLLGKNSDLISPLLAFPNSYACSNNGDWHTTRYCYKFSPKMTWCQKCASFVFVYFVLVFLFCLVFLQKKKKKKHLKRIF